MSAIKGTELKNNVEPRFIVGTKGLSAFFGGVGDSIIEKFQQNGIPSVTICGTKLYPIEALKQWVEDNGVHNGYRRSNENEPNQEQEVNETPTPIPTSTMEGFKFVDTSRARCRKTKL